MVVSNTVCFFHHFHPYLGKISILTHIFEMGWFNHQPDSVCFCFWAGQKNLGKHQGCAIGFLENQGNKSAGYWGDGIRMKHVVNLEPKMWPRNIS